MAAPGLPDQPERRFAAAEVLLYRETALRRKLTGYQCQWNERTVLLPKKSAPALSARTARTADAAANDARRFIQVMGLSLS